MSKLIPVVALGVGIGAGYFLAPLPSWAVGLVTAMLAAIPIGVLLLKEFKEARESIFETIVLFLLVTLCAPLVVISLTAAITGLAVGIYLGADIAKVGSFIFSTIGGLVILFIFFLSVMRGQR